MYKTMHCIGDFLMDEIMGTSTINQDYYWAMFNKTPDFESLRGKKFLAMHLAK